MATAKTSLVETAAKASSFNKKIEVHDDKIAFKMAGRWISSSLKVILILKSPALLEGSLS